MRRSLVLLCWTLVAQLCLPSFAFAPPRSAHKVTCTPSTTTTSRLYFFGKNKQEGDENDSNNDDDDSSKKPFFARFLDQVMTTKSAEPPAVEQEPKEQSPQAMAAVAEKPPAGVDKPVEETPLSKAKALKAQAERMRLEAERMDAQLTLDKIERLERELVQARKKQEGVEELQKEMDVLQAKLRGEPPRPTTTVTKTESKPPSTTDATTTTFTEGQPVDEEAFQKYLKEFKQAPKFVQNIIAGAVGLYSSDFEDLNATEVALRLEMRDRSDYSFVKAPKPVFSDKEIEEVKKDMLFELKMASQKDGQSEDEVARRMLEDQYYADLLAKQNADEVGDDLAGFFDLEQILEKTELDQMTESLFPPATRKEGQSPTMEQAMTLVKDVLPKASFNPSSKPEPVSGGFIIRGTSKLKDNDKLIESIDAEIAKSSIRDRLTVFYVNDYTVFTDDQLENTGFNPQEADPILLVTGPNVTREPRRLLYSAISAMGVGSSWYLSIYPFLLNPDLMKRAQEQMSLADANMAYDLTWLTDLSLPLFVTFMGIQLAHEAGHRAVAAAYNMNITVPMFIPSILTGMTSTVTSFKSPPKNKQAMFDFAIAGPLTGIVASLAAIYFGLEFTVFSTAEAYAQFPALPLDILRQSTLGGGLVEFILGSGVLSVPEGAAGTSAIASINIPLHPVAIAGYIGLIVNALSLLPIGTTDGGRISLTLFNRGAKIVLGQLFLFLLLGVGLVGSDLLLFYFSFLIFFQKGNEIPSRNEVDDLPFSRVLLSTVAGVIALLALIPIS